jgi:hypothetical protein
MTEALIILWFFVKVEEQGTCYLQLKVYLVLPLKIQFDNILEENTPVPKPQKSSRNN